MSKQTINIGASPNDGTGTPLRTSFDYTNQNFTELYTAVGPSGNNIVVPGTATITGAATVGTTLAVTGNLTAAADSILGTGSKATDTLLDFKADTGTQRIYLDRGGRNLIFKDVTTNIENYRITGVTGVHTWGVGGTTAMTLNSTGLGIGVAPVTDCKLTVRGGSIFDRGVGGGSPQLLLSLAASSGGNYGQISNTGTRWALGFGGTLTTVGTEALVWDSSGNVGIGVTPSAWQTGLTALQFAANGVLYGNGTNGSFFGNNYYTNSSGDNKYILTNYATAYGQVSGAHQWFNSPVGTAGNAITFTQAMTLDASGYLLLGTTDTTFTSGAGYKFGPGATPSNGQVGASSSNGDLTLRVYSTGAAAYRFYVGFGGTVFATSATISAISDARLKENVQNLDVGLNEILALKPRKFDWKAGKGKDIKGDRGFIAQEFETVFPNLIDEWADPAPEGEAPYKSVRQDLIPVLVKAIQELTARVQTLETR